MPVDTLRGEAEAALNSATNYLRAPQQNERRRQSVLLDLKGVAARLSADIAERSNVYVGQLDASEDADIEAKARDLHSNANFHRAKNAQAAQEQRFEKLRQINGGGYPRNVSPVIYFLGLLGIAAAEWYVNFSTFAAIFVPVVAIAGTIIVAFVFAGASHVHGAYLKQLAEILHPSIEYRHKIGRRLVLILATLGVLAAFITIVVVRYYVIIEQLGVDYSSGGGTFGRTSSSLVWSRLGPTIALNLFIWGIGTGYAYAMHERVPELREAFRDMIRANRRLDSVQQPFNREKKRILAQYARERENNQVALKEHRTLLEEVQATTERLRQDSEELQ